MTIMERNGLWYEAAIPANIFTNPEQAANLDQTLGSQEIVLEPQSLVIFIPLQHLFSCNKSEIERC